MMNTDTRQIPHLRMIALKTTVIAAASVAGILLSAMLLNIFMLGSI